MATAAAQVVTVPHQGALVAILPEEVHRVLLAVMGEEVHRGVRAGTIPEGAHLGMAHHQEADRVDTGPREAPRVAMAHLPPKAMAHRLPRDTEPQGARRL